MARPREFDMRKACEDAMNVFWEGGFKDTSLPDLLDGIKLSRGSLYKAFGSKRNVFLEALKLYNKTEWQPGVRLLNSAEQQNGRECISLFFQAAIDRVAQGDRRGCLLCNAAVGAAHKDAEISDTIQLMLNNATAGFETSLKETKSCNGLSRSRIYGKAHMLTSTYIGLRVLARSGAKLNDMESVAKSVSVGL